MYLLGGKKTSFLMINATPQETQLYFVNLVTFLVVYSSVSNANSVSFWYFIYNMHSRLYVYVYEWFLHIEWQIQQKDNLLNWISCFSLVTGFQDSYYKAAVAIKCLDFGIIIIHILSPTHATLISENIKTPGLWMLTCQHFWLLS